ncbi:MAG: hypothetical protein ACR2M1_04355 [Gemmatimonadaceae bacterium]
MVASVIVLACASGCVSVSARPHGSSEFWGFTAPWDPRSAASVAAHRSDLGVVVSGFITLDSVSLRPITVFGDTATVSSPGNAGNPRKMALVTAYEGNRFHPETIRILAENATERARTAGAVGLLAGNAHYRGLILDFEGLTPADLDGLIRVAREIADSARAHGVSPIAMAIPATDTAAYPARPLLSAVDILVVMLYDQHWLTSPPGPIAAPNWMARALGMRVGEVGPSRLVAALPTYGYQWRSDSATAVVSFDDAEQLARAAHVPLVRDPASATLHAETPLWSVWVSDATLLDSLVNGSRTLGVSKFALWRLGLEDPRMWTTVIKR